MLLALFLYCLLPTLTSAEQCPSGSVFNAQFEKCYVFSSTPAPYALAEQACINLGGHLVSISNAYENDVVSDNTKTALVSTNSTDFWIGANDLITAGKWAWTDGSNYLYTNWAPGQPQVGKDCASSRLSDVRWMANDCLLTKAYTCSVPPQPAFTCPPPPTCAPITTHAPVVCTPRQCTPHCDSEWTYFSQTDSCFKVFFGQKWDDAEAFCVEQGGHLASVHSEQENTFVANLARTNQKQSNPNELTWIGLKASGNEWKWTDNTKTDYINWAPKQPDNPGKENCVEYNEGSAEESDVNHIFHPFKRLDPEAVACCLRSKQFDDILPLVYTWLELAQDTSDHGWYENWNNENCNTVMRAFVCKKKSIS